TTKPFAPALQGASPGHGVAAAYLRRLARQAITSGSPGVNPTALSGDQRFPAFAVLFVCDEPRPHTASTLRPRHPHHRIVFRGGGTRIFVHKDAARAAARSPRADDGRPRGTDTLDRHDGVHYGDVGLVDSHPAAVESDRVLFLDHRKIERRLVAAVTDLTAATAARGLEGGKF